MSARGMMMCRTQSGVLHLREQSHVSLCGVSIVDSEDVGIFGKVEETFSACEDCVTMAKEMALLALKASREKERNTAAAALALSDASSGERRRMALRAQVDSAILRRPRELETLRDDWPHVSQASSAPSTRNASSGE